MKQKLSEEEGRRMLTEADCGVLSLVTPEGEAYGIPIHPVYLPEENCVVFHCAKKGKKLDCIAVHPQVSLCVYAHVKIIPKNFSTQYESTLVTGNASLVEENAERYRLLRILSDRLCPGEPLQEEMISRYDAAVAVYRITIEQITAKRNAGQ